MNSESVLLHLNLGQLHIVNTSSVIALVEKVDPKSLANKSIQWNEQTGVQFPSFGPTNSTASSYRVNSFSFSPELRVMLILSIAGNSSSSRFAEQSFGVDDESLSFALLDFPRSRSPRDRLVQAEGRTVHSSRSQFDSSSIGRAECFVSDRSSASSEQPTVQSPSDESEDQRFDSFGNLSSRIEWKLFAHLSFRCHSSTELVDQSNRWMDALLCRR